MRILVDLDGIVVDTLPTWLKRIHETTGVLAKTSDITKWNLNENPPLDTVPFSQLIDPLNEKDFNANLPQMADACHYLHQLHNAGHDISIVTARSGTNCIPETLAWLKEKMPWLNVKKIWFCYDKHRITGDVLIDDKAETLIEYRNAFPNAHLITIDYPYNQHAPEGTHRVQKNGYEWEAIESLITRISNGL